MASKCIVAAIDFGTEFSGWACSFQHEYEEDPTKIYVRRWKGNLSPKAPTAVLIKPDGKTFEAFGYEAEDRYAELAEEEDHGKWYYFRRFKMHLYDVNILRRNFEIKDETGKSLRAMTVFNMAINFLKEDLLQNCSIRSLVQISLDDVTWVITVPAIWNDSAKQFMREAAVEAGIPSDSLTIALEPECASILCRLLKVDKVAGEESFSLLKEGSQYMVLDAGGGTVDITVYKVCGGGKLQELYKASGGEWGGIQVDHAFKQFIIDIVGSQVYLDFSKNNMEDYLHMSRDFEIKKRDFEPHKNARISMRFPRSLKEIYETESGKDIQEAIANQVIANQVHFFKDKLRLEAVKMKEFFQMTINSITAHVRGLLATPMVMGTTTVLMVGGFSESKVMQDAIQSNFPDMKIILPQDAGLAVLKGAVLFGHCPTTVATRIARYTYGLCLDPPFEEGIHDESKRRTDVCLDGIRYRCRDVFHKIVELGQSINVDEEICAAEGYPSDYEDFFTDINLYASIEKSPKYVTDDDCFKLGTMRVNIEDMSVPRHERRIKVFILFGGTEIRVRAVESRTGRNTKCTIDLLG